jgi:hypothetical protein
VNLKNQSAENQIKLHGSHRNRGGSPIDHRSTFEHYFTGLGFSAVPFSIRRLRKEGSHVRARRPGTSDHVHGRMDGRAACHVRGDWKRRREPIKLHRYSCHITSTRLASCLMQRKLCFGPNCIFLKRTSRISVTLWFCIVADALYQAIYFLPTNLSISWRF